MSYRPKAWITGSKGYIGRELVRQMKSRGYTVVDTDIEVDITDLDAVKQYAGRIRPDIIVNAAGISRSRTSAASRLEAYRVNGLGARNLAEAANERDAIIVQVSSDDVFASRPEPYNEFDIPAPDTLYGKSKLAGESFVRELNPRHIVVRSSFVYHARGGRLKALVDAAASGRKLTARTDQYAAPTSTATCVDFIARAIEAEQFGIFHVVTRGQASRYEFAAAALELAGFAPETVLVPEADAASAENVVLEPLMADLIGIMDMPDWRDDLRVCLADAGLCAAGTTKGGE